MPQLLKLFLNLFVALPCLIGLPPAHAGQKVYVGTKTPDRQQSYHQVEHHPWHRLLKKYVDADGRVDYRAWKASPQDSARLSDYLSSLSCAHPRLKSTEQAKLAFWINAYNAVTVYGILQEYPTTSIRNHTAQLFGYNIWKDLQLFVGGRAYSLDDMEHAILRKMQEPRIHFAIVCASKGCPRLLNEAYLADQIEQQLDRNASDFFSRRQNFQQEGERFALSAILKWYGADFGKSQTEQLKTVARWLPTEEARKRARSGEARVFYLDYDWSLNAQPNR